MKLWKHEGFCPYTTAERKRCIAEYFSVYIFLLILLFPTNLFCQQDHEMLLDSTLWFKWSTDDSTWSPRPRLLINRYDPLGNLISEIHSGSSNPENDEWANYDSCGYVYDNFGRIIKRVQYKWDSKTNEWLEYEGRFNTYDTSGNITETEYSWWDWNCVVDDRGRDIKTYTYDSNGNITEHISYDWNRVNLEWEARRRTWKTYDSSGNLT
ncbi:MAG: hypothetical protein GY790_17320, partial [Bacteroidetes bacterium]|nr:hypothetical protein [Bacteroidota bacterium]